MVQIKGDQTTAHCASYFISADISEGWFLVGKVETHKHLHLVGMAKYMLE